METKNSWNLIVDKLDLWFREFIKLLPNMALAALILVVGIFLSKLIRKIAGKFIEKLSANYTVNNLFVSFIYLLCIGITLFSTLSILKLDRAVTSILAGAGIIGLALAFAFQDIAANFISGIFLSFRKPLKIGDIVNVKDYMGKVTDINLRDTVIVTFQGKTVIIPNKEVFQTPIENFSILGKRRMDLVVGVSYGEDLENVRRITLDAVQRISVRAREEEITLFFQEFADSSINFVLRVWVQSPEQPVFLQAQSEAVMLIKKAYDINNIVIPFPIRTLDFGIKGGKTLSEMEVNTKQSL